MESSHLNPCKLTTIHEAIEWIKFCLSSEGKSPMENIAAGITGLNCNDLSEQWIKEDDNFARILELSEMLEVRGVYIPLDEHPKAWATLKDNLAVLEKKY
jgi:hypothetical protein